MTAPHSSDVPDSRRPVTRDEGVKYADILQPRNTFGGRQLYYSTAENSIFLANERWKVEAEYQDLDGNFLRTATSLDAGRFFDGEYQSGPFIYAGEQLRLHLTFPNEPGGKYPGGYAYGYFILSFYSGSTAPISDVDLQVYCTHTGQGVGWKTITLNEISDPKQSSSFSILSGYSSWHGPSDVVLTIKNTGEGNAVRPTEFEFYNTRPMGTDTPMVSKYRDESLYRRLSWYSGWDRNAYIDEDGTAEFRALRSGSGPTSNRPSMNSTTVGTQFFDTTIGRPIWWDGSKWINASGGAV